MTSPKPKAPKLSEQAKHILRNQRRQLAQQQAAAASRAAIEARSLLGREYKPVSYTPAAPVHNVITDTALAYHRGVVPRVTAVLASEGIEARVNYDLAADVPKSAYTDFQSIYVNYPVVEGADPYEVSCILRGLGYHEGGHIRFTTKPENLLSGYIGDTKYPTAEREAAKAEWEAHKNLYHYAWNLCEDQRMEMLVVEDSPRKATYFAPMVIDMVMDWERTQQDPAAAQKVYEQLRQALANAGIDLPAWDADAQAKQRVASYPLIAWRRYLPRELRRTLRAAFVNVWGDTLTRRIDRLILTYITAKDARTMIQAILELAPLLKQVMAPQNDHGRMTRDNWYAKTPSKPKPGASMDDAESDFDGEGEGEGAAEPQKSAQGKGKSTPKVGAPAPQPQQPEADDTSKGAGKAQDEDEADESDDDIDGEGDDDSDDEAPVPQDQPQGKGQGNEKASHDVDQYDEIRKALEDAKAAAEEAVRNDSAIQQDVLAFNTAFYQDVTGSRLLPYLSRPNNDADTCAEAYGMAQQMVQAFMEVNQELTPTWQEQQTRGVLNVGRYVTRQPGDREFFRTWADEIAPGRDVAVSVLLDYSGSMGGSENALAAVAYAMKSACDELEIPCTVALWDTEAVLLWEGMEKAAFVPVIVPNGGTDPATVLEDVQYQRYEKAKHIVLIMTDGGFSTRPNWLNEYRTEGTYFLGAIYGNSSKAMEEQMAVMGFDRYACITTLEPLVKMLEAAVIDVAAMPV